MPVQCICQRCGSSFMAKPSYARRARFCSIACKGEASRTISPATCQQCGREFRPTYSQGTNRFCSNDCYADWRNALPADQRTALMSNATALIRGSKRSHDDLCKRARTKQERCVLSGDEAAIMDAFHQRGLQPIPLYAVDKYNIDFAFPEAKVAVEYHGGNWHNTPAKRAGDAVKAAYLDSVGWRLLVFPRLDKPQANTSGNRRITIAGIVAETEAALRLA